MSISQLLLRKINKKFLKSTLAAKSDWKLVSIIFPTIY